MALLTRTSTRLPLSFSVQRALSLHTTLPSLSSSPGSGPSPAPYARAPPLSGSPSPVGLSKTAEFVISKVDNLVNWAHRSSIWPLTFGLACCAVEMMHTGASRYDLDCFGIIFRPSPRQTECMIVAGFMIKCLSLGGSSPWEAVQMVVDTITTRTLLFEVVTGLSLLTSMFLVARGCDRIVPVDIYVPGCPPTAEVLTLWNSPAAEENQQAQEFLPLVDQVRAFTFPGIFTASF